ncbi:MAG TPA: hypothetical protein VGJ32_08320 [Solirubrobacteraceae bacterium]|jgi:hypothetical protein
MRDHHDDIPDDLRPVAAWLRDERPAPSPLELDQIKLRARAKADRRARIQGRKMKLKSLLATVLAAGLVAGGAGGVMAASGTFTSHKSAASSQYKPGKGCGDKNHIHERENECKKPPK